MRFSITTLAFLFIALGSAQAAGTRAEIQGPEEFLEGEMKGLALDEEGLLRPAPIASESWTIDAPYVWCLARDAKGRVLAGSGDSGVIYREEKGGLEPWAKTLALEVVSLLVRDDEVLAGTGPDGTVYRVDKEGGTEVALDLPLQTVWSLAHGAEEGSWLAGAGPGARLYRYRSGHNGGELLHEFSATNLMTLLRDETGLWIGTQGPGLLYRIEGSDDNAPRLVYESAEEEIRAVVTDGAGGVYLLSLSVPRNGESGEGTGARSRILWLPKTGGQEEVLSVQRRLLCLTRLPDGHLLAGEAVEGRLHRIDPQRGRGVIWGEVDGADPLVLLVEDDGSLVVGTGNPGAVYRLSTQPQTGGEFISAVLSTPGAEAWGRLWVDGISKGVKVRARSGIRREPDASWSTWSDALPIGEVLQAPVAPYLQYQLEIPKDASVSGVRLAWRERNLRPRLLALKIEDAGIEMTAGGANGAAQAPVSQRFDDGLTVEYSYYPPSKPVAPEASAWARGLRTVRWRGEDPNEDRLRYAVELRPESAGEWYSLAENLESSVFAWDTRSFEDGDYRIRILADDGLDNTVSEVRSAELSSGVLHVDNTSPELLRLEWTDQTTATLVGEVRDAMSPLASLAVRFDEGEWIPVEPVDGVLDGPHEHFLVEFGDAAHREQHVWLRAQDVAGNVLLTEQPRP